jgi:NAD-dependent deacetylase
VADSRLVERLQASQRILVFSGAGVSTASGIPDFRGPGGVWTRRRPVYYEEFLASEAARVEYWDFKLETWDIYQRAQPNAVHDAIVALERAGKVVRS